MPRPILYLSLSPNPQSLALGHHTSQLLPSLLLHTPVLLQPDRLHANEPACILRRESSDGIHAALVHVVEFFGGGGAAEDTAGAFVCA